MLGSLILLFFFLIGHLLILQLYQSACLFDTPACQYQTLCALYQLVSAIYCSYTFYTLSVILNLLDMVFLWLH